ncbi:MAG TPA: EAL domain-containing protein, partial [Burkholderiales bacterium]|nr:EAL domain-containing protein [Burkholderiales bacterium]
ACVIPGEGGEPIFVCMEVDITDVKAAEREREQLSTVLSRVTETIPVCLSYIDPEGCYVWTNAHNSKRLGTTPDRMIGKNVRDVNLAVTGGRWTGAMLEAARRGISHHDECEWRDADGTDKSYERYVVPDKDADGAFRGYTSVWVDITARKEAERKIQRLNRVHSVLSNIDAALVRTKNRQELFDEACRIAVEHGGFGVAWIGVFNTFTKRVDSVALSGSDALDLRVMESLSRDLATAGCQLLGRCIRTKKPIIENDMSMKKPQEGTLRRRAVTLGYESVIFLPLIVNGEVAGVFCMMAKESNFFNDEEVRLLTNMASDVAYAVEGIDKETRINYLAYYDMLTGLPNRTLFYERLGQLVQSAQQRGLKLALLVVDIRRFRFVNESLGRQLADNLLCKVAERFLNSWAEPDNVGRLSGDRFALALGAYENDALLVHAIEQSIIEALKTPFLMDGQEVSVSSAAGIAVYPDDGADVETLFKNAEAAVGQAKRAAEPYMFYQPKMNARMAEGLLLENRMRRALEKEQFVMHYQPKVAIKGAGVVGFEALIRWNDPEVGMVAPGNFIPILEETGMIVEVGQWAMRRVLRDHAVWNQAGLRPPRIAVNVSAIQLLRKDFTDQVRALVTEASFEEPGLDIEITESLLMHDIEGCIAKLKIIRDLGVNIAIDDFGTGYSSLAYLSKLPVNALKIDRSFIDGMLRSDENMSIVSSIISLAHAMKLKVIAEGVETQEQLSVLRRLECDEIQGYLISRPVGAADVVKMLHKSAVETVS